MLLGAKSYLAKMNISQVLASRMLLGKLLQSEVAECLKSWDANVVDIEL